MKKQNFLSRSITLAALLVIGLSACAPVTPPAPLAAEPTQAPTPAPTQAPTIAPTLISTRPAAPTAAPMPTLTQPAEEQSRTLPPKAIGQATAAATNAPMLGEAPQTIMAAVLKDLEQRTGSQPVNFTILRSESVTWNDGALGCPKRGVFYTQATVEGYWVVVQINSQTFDYRIATRGPSLMLCEK